MKQHKTVREKKDIVDALKTIHCLALDQIEWEEEKKLYWSPIWEEELEEFPRRRNAVIS